MSAHQNALETAGVSFIERLAHRIGITANAECIYAEPVERDGVTVIPVAKAVYGFGGGSGKNDAEEGGGGGGGVVLKPVGYIEIKDGKTRFCPTRDVIVYASLIAAIAPLALFMVWRLAKAIQK